MQDFNEFSELEKLIAKGTAGFEYSTPIIRWNPENAAVVSDLSKMLRKPDPLIFDVEKTPEGGFDMDLRAFYLVGIASGLNVLTVGGTRTGKSAIMRGIGGGLFGKGYGFIQIDPSITKDLLMNVIFSSMDPKNNKTLKEALVPTDAFNKPFFAFDEVNRMPPQTASQYNNLLDNGIVNFEGGGTATPGIRIKEGKVVNENTPGAKPFQVKFGTANVGSQYSGTFQFDKASRNRWHITLDLDLYPISYEDSKRIEAQGGYAIPQPVDNETADAAIRTIVKLNDKIKRIEVDEVASDLISYLERMNQCYESPDGLKTKILGFDAGTNCDACPGSAKNSSVCGNVYALPPGVADNLTTLMKAFSAYRIHKIPESEKKATIQDVFHVAPFVLADKLDISDNWVQKYGRSSDANALKLVLKEAFDRWKTSMEVLTPIYLKQAEGKPLTADDDKKVAGALTNDPWGARDIASVRRLGDHIYDITGGKGVRELNKIRNG
jgi:hypothetical protein